MPTKGNSSSSKFDVSTSSHSGLLGLNGMDVWTDSTIKDSQLELHHKCIQWPKCAVQNHKVDFFNIKSTAKIFQIKLRKYADARCMQLLLSNFLLYYQRAVMIFNFLYHCQCH